MATIASGFNPPFFSLPVVLLVADFFFALSVDCWPKRLLLASDGKIIYCSATLTDPTSNFFWASLASFECPMSSNMSSASLPANSMMISGPPGCSSRYGVTLYTFWPPTQKDTRINCHKHKQSNLNHHCFHCQELSSNPSPCSALSSSDTGDDEKSIQQ